MEEGLELLLPHMKKELHPRLRQTLRKGILGYDPNSTTTSSTASSSSRLLDYFSSIKSDPANAIVDGGGLVDKAGGRPLPSILWKSLRSGELAPQILNMFVNSDFFPFVV